MLRRAKAKTAMSGGQPGAFLAAIDFGCSQVHYPGQPPLTSTAGTPLFMAPEVYMGKFNGAADLWSVGMIMYLVIAGCYPWWCRHCFALYAQSLLRQATMADKISAGRTWCAAINDGPWRAGPM